MRERQRIGSYAVCVLEGAVLLTRLRGSERWTLPGGGIDHGEDPRDAVVREVFEETGLRFAVGALLDVQSRHWQHADPDGATVDVHSVHLLFAGAVTGGTLTHEVDGSSDRAEWVPLGQVAGLTRVSTVDVGLAALSSAGPPR